MSKQNKTESLKIAGLHKKQLAKMAELEARDEFERKWALEDLTNPEKVGLSSKHANLISDKLREAYIKNEILSQVDEDEDEEEDIDEDIEDDDDIEDIDEDEDDAEDEDEDVDDAEDFDEDIDEDKDDIELTKPISDDSFELEKQDDEPKKNFKNKILFEEEESPADSLGMGELEDELKTKDLGFPSEEDEEEEEEDEEEDESIVPKDKALPEIGLDKELPFEEDNEEEVSLDSNKDKVILELPGGQKLSLELLENLAKTPKEEKFMAASKDNSIQKRSASRRDILASLFQEAEQAETEYIKPKTDKALGNDTSSKGKNFIMEDATRGVANPGVKSEKMVLENSEGNSLLSDPGFTDNNVPTVNPELLANNTDAFEINKFEQGNSGLFTKKVINPENQIPTMGDKDLMWGDKGLGEFEVPTQLNTTQQRRTNVLASRTVECSGCTNDDSAPLYKVACEDCGNELVLCSHCLKDNYCPSCAGKEREACLNLDGYCKTEKDRAEIVEDNRGDGDLNNDGGFRANKKEDNDLEVKASIKINQLEKENQGLKLTLVKFAKAVEAATIMAHGESIDVTEIPTQVNEFMDDQSISAAGLEKIKQAVAAINKKNSRTKLANIEAGMKKGASASRNSQIGLGFNPNPTQEDRFNHVSDMKESLQRIFTYPKPDDE